MTTNTRTNWLAIAIGLVTTLLVYFVVSTLVQNTVQRVLLNVYVPSDTQVTVSSVNAAGQIVWAEDQAIKANTSFEAQIVATSALNLPLESLRIELQRQPPVSAGVEDLVLIYNIQVQMPYSDDYFFGAEFLTISQTPKPINTGIPSTSAQFEVASAEFD